MLLITIVKVGTTANEQERIAVLEKQSPWNTNMGDWATFYVSVVKYLYIVVFFTLNTSTLYTYYIILCTYLNR